MKIILLALILIIACKQKEKTDLMTVSNTGIQHIGTDTGLLFTIDTFIYSRPQITFSTVTYETRIMDSLGVTAYKKPDSAWVIIDCERSIIMLTQLLKDVNNRYANLKQQQ